MLILGGHLGNMLISNSCYYTLYHPKCLIVLKITFPDFGITQIGDIQQMIEIGGHFGLCKLGAFPYWDFLGLLVWCSGDIIETHCGKKNSVAICSK